MAFPAATGSPGSRRRPGVVRTLRRLGRGARRAGDEKGAILIIWAVALTALAGFLALAVDAGNLVQNNTNFQNGADAAALSAAADIRADTGTDAVSLSNAERAATTDAENVGNGYITNGGGTPGNWTTCTGPAGFTPINPSRDNCVAFYQYNLAQTNVGLTARGVAETTVGQFTTVVQPAENLSVTAPSASGQGSSITATAMLSGPSTSDPGGSISFWVYQSTTATAPTSCPNTTATGWRQVRGARTTVPVAGYGSYPSPRFIPPLPGYYYWYASYSGDSNDVPTDSGCGVAIWVQIPVQHVPSLVGSGGGAALSPFAYSFGSTWSVASDGKLCYYPASCNAAS